MFFTNRKVYLEIRQLHFRNSYMYVFAWTIKWMQNIYRIAEHIKAFMYTFLLNIPAGSNIFNAFSNY